MKTRREHFIWIILFFMATAFSFAVDDRQMNLLLVGIMGMIPLFLMVQYPHLLKDEKIIYLLIFTITISFLAHLESFRISSLIYTSMFLITFIFLKRLISSIPLKIERYIKILKFILIAYFVILIIQQLLVAVDSPYVLNFIAGDTGIYKLNSLSPEPSHTARIIVVIMYSYVLMLELKMGRAYDLLKDSKKNTTIWFMFLYTMLTMGSGFAIVLLLIFFLKFLSFKRLIFLFPVLIIAFVLILNIDIPAVERVSKFGEAFLKLDPNLMLVADHSASMRIVPIFFYINNFNIYDINTWLGFGTDYTANLMPTLISGIPQGEFRGGGVFPAFFLDRGLICVILLFLMIKKFCLRKLFSYDTALLFLLIFAANINTQLFWISISLFTINKYFYQTQQKDERTYNT